MQELFEIKGDLLVRYHGYEEHVVIPEGITAIGIEAFAECESMRSVVIPASVAAIGRRAFSKCYNLSSVQFLGDPEYIDDSAFSLCPSMVDENWFVIIKNILFNYYGKGKDVAIPDGVTAIGERAFCVWESLHSVVIPGSVQSIGKRAFRECRNLRSVQLPETLTDIGAEAFEACEKLADTDGFVIVNDILFSYHGSAIDVVVPNGVKAISGAFGFGENVRSITISDSVTKIGRSAFAGCRNLKAVFIPESVIEIHETAFPQRGRTEIFTTERSFAAGYARRKDIPLQLVLPPICLADYCAEKNAATAKEKLHAGNDLYLDLLNGFKEMAEDARAEDDVLSLIDRYLEDPAALSAKEKANMEWNIWKGIAYVWDRMATTVSCHSRVPLKKMQQLLRETYKVFTLFHKDNFVPKGVANILLYMDEYLHRAHTAIDYAEGDVKAIAWSQYGLLYDMVISLKDGFFDGEYKAAYPILSVHDSIKDKYLFDVLNDNLKEMAQR